MTPSIECRVELSEVVVTVGDKVILQLPYTENDDGSITIESAVGLGVAILNMLDQLDSEYHRGQT